MAESERLFDCLITYHLMSGQTVSESFRNDIPSEVWATILQDFVSFEQAMELQPSDTYAKALLPKSNISYITMKVLTST